MVPERVSVPVPEPESVRFRLAPEMMELMVTPPEPSMTILLFIELPRIIPIVPVPEPVKVKFPLPELRIITLLTEFIVAPLSVRFPLAALELFCKERSVAFP